MNRDVLILVLIGGGVAVVVGIRRAAKKLVAEQVTKGILEKLGSDAPPNAVKAAQAAGECFANEVGIIDIVSLAFGG